jgi:WD40 repeat protein
MEIPHELVNAIVRGDAVLFIGAGLSIDAGLPGWNELLEPLANSISLPMALRTDPLKVAQYYQNKRGRNALLNHISEQTDTIGKAPTANHVRLARLGIHTWVTSNYDSLLEQTLHQAEMRFIKVVCDHDLSATSSETMTLIKLHGDREQPNTIVITQQDYETYFRHFPRVKQKLTSLLVDKTFLFIGYSINDPDFNQIQSEIVFDLKDHHRTAYAVLFDADEFTNSYLRERNIHVLNISMGDQSANSSKLGSLLDELNHRAEQSRRNRAPKLQPLVPITVPYETVQFLLEAMGYRIIDKQAVGSDLYFFCDARWGVEIRQEVVHFVGGEPVANHIVSLNEAVLSHNAARGILLTSQRLSPSLHDMVHQRERIQAYTLAEFTDRLADFRPYLQSLIREYETSDIPRFYVPLTVRAEVEQEELSQDFEPLESYLDTWLNQPGRNYLSILGDFGSGKTWFCQHYAYLTARRCLSDPRHNRIPLLITLRDYTRAYDIEQLITDAIVNRFKVGLAAGYKTFAQLNESGRLLLIFDGFDEMERRVSDYRTKLENFWELTRAASQACKVLLTCRTPYFRHRNEEEEILIPSRDRITLSAGEQVIDLHERKGFEVIHLLDFTDEDIQSALQKRLSNNWESAYKKIEETANLLDLASRPVLLDMIVKTLPQFQNADRINLATLYKTYVDSVLQGRWRSDSDSLSPKDRLYFMQELAWEMVQADRQTVPFSEFPERIIKYFELKNDPGRATFLDRDVRTQSYLVRDDMGNYGFHKSFLEYFVSCKMATALDHLHEDVTHAVEVWKTGPLTPELRNFLVDMVSDAGSQTDYAPLLRHLIEATRNKSFAEAGYAGGNAATLLHLQGYSFTGEDLSYTVLVGADLSHCDLTEANLQNANLCQANLRGCTLVDTNMRDTDLMHIRVGEMGAVEAVAFDLTGKIIASGSTDGVIRLWKYATGEEIGRFFVGAPVTSICFSSDGRSILAGVGQHGHIKMWDTQGLQPTYTFIGHTGLVWDIAFAPGKQRFASGADDGSIRIWNMQSGEADLVLHKRDRGIWDVSFSPCGSYIAAAGGHELAIYHTSSGELVWKLESESELRSVKYSSTNLLAYTTRQGKLFLLDAVSKQMLYEGKVVPVGPNNIAFSPNGQMLAIGGSGHNAMIYIMQTETHQVIAEGCTESNGYIGRVYWGTDSSLVSGGSDGIIHVWNLQGHSPQAVLSLKTLESRMDCSRMRISGARGLDAAAPGNEGTLREWFSARGAQERFS